MIEAKPYHAGNSSECTNRIWRARYENALRADMNPDEFRSVLEAFNSQRVDVHLSLDAVGALRVRGMEDELLAKRSVHIDWLAGACGSRNNNATN